MTKKEGQESPDLQNNGSVKSLESISGNPMFGGLNIPQNKSSQFNNSGLCPGRVHLLLLSKEAKFDLNPEKFSLFAGEAFFHDGLK